MAILVLSHCVDLYVFEMAARSEERAWFAKLFQSKPNLCDNTLLKLDIHMKVLKAFKMFINKIIVFL